MNFKCLLIFLTPMLLFGEVQREASVPVTPLKDATKSAQTCHDLNGVYVTADFLYWKARQDGMEYVAVFEASFPSNTFSQVSIRSIEIDFEYKPGFRLGLGGDLPWDGWDLYLNWTRLSFDISSTKTSNQADLDLIEGLFSSPPFLGTRARIDWDLTHNALDFEMGRRLFLSSSLTVRPAWGLKTVWFDEEIKRRLDHVELFNPNGPGLPGAPEFLNFDFDIWGIGPMLSLSGKWNWAYGLGLVGQFSGAILWYDIDQNTHVQDNGVEDQGGSVRVVTQANVKLKYDTNRIRPWVQAFVGLDWEWCFIPNWLSVQLAIGYEVQYFWSMFVDPINSLDDLPISFEGLTVKARIDF
ncbi:Lpg1974 family pore-forming outer membrane protein [Simkania sp.]|uniref:Lpg1974 family pore-forming outer membrane protein n=1 Tax=Simkania sp. TaxID=34094 RepID=UPI003B51F593